MPRTTLGFLLLGLGYSTVGLGQGNPPFTAQPVSSAAMQFIEAGLPLAQLEIGDSKAIAVSDAKRRSVVFELCEFGHKNGQDATVVFARCPSGGTVVLEVIVTSGTLPGGISFGMSTSEVIARLGVPSMDRAKIAAHQGLVSPSDENTDLYYLADPNSVDAWLVELQFERTRLTRVRWLLGTL